MAAKFAYCKWSYNTTLDGQTAIALLDASQHQGLRAALYGTATPSRWVNLTDYTKRDNCGAVLMQGTTPELRAALEQAIRDQMDGFWSTGDLLLVWYMRRKTGYYEQQTVALIMPCKAFLRPQRLNPNAIPSQEPNMQSWAELFRTTEEGQGNFGGVPFRYLIDTLLPTLSGVQAWV